VALTPAGSRTIRRAAPDHVRSVRRHFIDLLSAREIKTLSTFAARVAARLAGAEAPNHATRDEGVGNLPPADPGDAVGNFKLR
jgi:hypothetical protein